MNGLAYMLLGAAVALVVVKVGLLVLLGVLIRRHGWPPPGWRR